MSINNLEVELEAAWQRVDARLEAMQERHHRGGDIPLYRDDANPPATESEIALLEKAIGTPVPFEWAYSLKRANGRWIAHDHVIVLDSIEDYLFAFCRFEKPVNKDDNGSTLPFIIGPISPIFESRRRYCFGGHEYSNTSLYIDYEDPPKGGRLGQIIRIDESGYAEYVAPSFVDFLNMVANAPVHDDDPDFDPLKREWP